MFFWCINDLSTIHAFHVRFLESQQTGYKLKLDLGCPLTVVTMLLPMMNHQCRRMVIGATFDTPLFQESCCAWREPQLVKLSVLQCIMHNLIHGQVLNRLQ